MTPDTELLRCYANTNSEDAFAELVRRHVNLVFSAALRQVNGDAHLAQDVAQTVFTDLARKAGSLARRETLTGWLYTSTHFAAAKIVRTENRRRDREEKFMREPIQNSGSGTPSAQPGSEADWEMVRPVLDDAMHELRETDREAVLLRYFENQQFAELGAKLGLNENAARMRVERTLEKLRTIFAKRGITTATALSSVISANAVQLAPANLAATLSTASIAAGAGTPLTLLKIMTATQLKLGVSALVVAGVTTALVVQHQTQTQLRDENTSLRQQIAQLHADNEGFSNRLAEVGEAKSLTDEQFNDLLRLRGEVGMLRQRTNELGKLRASPDLATSNQQQSEDEKVDLHAAQEKAALFKMNNAKQSVMGMIMYANANEDQLPTNFDQAAPYLGGDLNSVRSNLSQLEIVYQGSWKSITNPGSTIIVRENQPWLYNGESIKVYGFADGHAQLHAEPDGDFGAWEQQHMAFPPPNQ